MKTIIISIIKLCPARPRCGRVRSWLAPLLGCCFSAAAVAQVPAANTPVRQEKLVLSGPPAVVSYPLIHMATSGELSDLADKVEFRTWTNPDQLRAIAMDGSADFVAMPTNVAANLYNRGVALRLTNVSVWGILWMLSRNPELKTLADFRGEEIAVPFRADMPDIMFTYLAEQAGLDPRTDFKVRYTATPLDAMQLLIMRKVDHALLAEPAVSMALRKTRSFPLSVVAPDLYRSIDLQQEWGRLLHTEPLVPQAGMVVLGKQHTDEAWVARLEQAYARSWQWCVDNAEACGTAAAQQIDLLTAEAATDAIHSWPRHYATAAEAKPQLQDFLQLLLDREPANVGGKLPDHGFYGLTP
ncbi:NitT/TauT family transport system substrate-binding protein [Marinobacterium sp. MBR-111]